MSSKSVAAKPDLARKISELSDAEAQAVLEGWRARYFASKD